MIERGENILRLFHYPDGDTVTLTIRTLPTGAKITLSDTNTAANVKRYYRIIAP